MKPATKKRAKPDSEDEDDDDASDMASLHDDTILSNTPPSAKKQKKEPKAKKAAGKPLAPLENEAASFDGASDAKKDNSERYQKVRGHGRSCDR